MNYCKHAQAEDEENAKKWNSDLDSLLTFVRFKFYEFLPNKILKEPVGCTIFCGPRHVCCGIV